MSARFCVDCREIRDADECPECGATTKEMHDPDEDVMDGVRDHLGGAGQ